MRGWLVRPEVFFAQAEAGAPPTAPDSAAETPARIVHAGRAAWDWLLEDAPTRLAWLAAALALFLILRALRGVVARRVRSEKAGDAAFRNIAAELIRNTWSIFLFFAAFALFAPFLALPASVAGMLHMMLVIVGALQAAIWARTLLTSVLVGMVSRNADDYSTLANASALLRIFVNVLVWALAIIFILDNLGANVATLVAGLGVGGIGIGLAAQGIFSDLFASLSIVLDKPFVRGDFIVFGDYKGSVEKIGLKATHIRALSGEQIVVSNTNLLNEKIQNYKRMVERRILFRLGVTYGTPADKLEKIPQWIKEAIDAVPRTRFDRSHFASYGDSSLDFETVYYALTAEYNVFMDMQQAINLAIFRKFAAEGVEFAYPTRTLYVEQAEKPAE